MSYSGGFGHAPRHHAPRHHVHRHSEHGARRSHANMERAMTQYEERRGGEPSEGGASPYDPREEYPHSESRNTHRYDRLHSHTERRNTNGYDRTQEHRARRFPNEGHDRVNEPEVVGGPSDRFGCRSIRFRNARRLRVGIYAQPDNESTNHNHGSQNREGSITQFNSRQALSPQSRRTPRNATRSQQEHVRESHNLASTDSAEWWAEYDRRDMRPTPNHQFIGYLTQSDEQDGGYVFVTNPYLTGRMAALASEVAAHR